MDVESDDEWEIPPDIEQTAANIVQELLPQTSEDRYNASYDKFCKWQSTRGTKSISVSVMLTYFQELAQTWKASTLWSHYSMLKSTIQLRHNLNIGAYNLLIMFLKRQSSGFQSKKTKTLSSQDVERFLKEAPDVEYLATKVALILSVCGACQGCELTNVTTSDVKDHDGIFLVKINDTKNKKPRSFTIEGSFYDIVKRFIAQRPKDVDTQRFFLNYQHGKFTKQPIGKNKFSSMPKQIAKYLGLADAESYTGHSFRRTSATLLVDSGANITTIKRHGGWRSDAVAEGYIEDSVGNKRRIGKMITSSINLKSKECDENVDQSQISAKIRKVETIASTSKFDLKVLDSNLNQSEKAIVKTVRNEASTSKILQNLINEEVCGEPLQKTENQPLSVILSNCTNCTISFK